MSPQARSGRKRILKKRFSLPRAHQRDYLVGTDLQTTRMLEWLSIPAARLIETAQKLAAI